MFEAVRNKLPIQGKNGSFADNTDALRLSQSFYPWAKGGEQSAADDNIIGFGGGYGDGVHPSTSSFRFLPSSSRATRASMSSAAMASR